MAIASSSRLSADEVTRRTFTTARKGFTPSEVRAFLDLVARELEAAGGRERELREALSIAEHRAANPVIDEATLTTALGQETAKVLRSAHDAAGEIMAKAETDAERIRAEASAHVERLLAEATEENERRRAEATKDSEHLRSQAEQAAEEVRSQAEAAATELRTRTEETAHELRTRTEQAAHELRTRSEEEATARLESAKVEADTLLTQARGECRGMVQEAQEMRARILADLTRRRRVLHSQIEQLRAGRDRLAETITEVRHTVDQVTDELFRAEDEARLAAEEAGRQAAVHEDLDESQGIEAVLPPTLAPGAGVDIELEPAEEERRQQAVEELFARLRAQQEAVEPATEALETAPEGPQPQQPRQQEANGQEPGGRQSAPGDHGAPARREKKPRAREHAGAEGVTVLGPLPPSDAPGTSTLPTGAAAVAVAVAEESQPTTPPDAAPDADADADEKSDEESAAPDPFLARRDELLGPAAAALARRLKRALADDQNDVLDRLRALGSFGPEVLASEDEERSRYRQAADGQLLEAARAGAVFGGGSPDDAPSVDDLSAELASSVVAPLRRHLLEAPAPLEDDEAAMVEHVGSAYREWKGQRVERLAHDHAHAAFSRAALAVTAEGRELRWLVDDDGGQCPDCDDNALAGALPRGEAFPTGHVHPPAHPGCRCLLVPGQA
jgi:DivIVA domain-containing protein